MAVAKTMPRYTTGSDRQVQWAAAASPLSERAPLGPRTTGKPRITVASDGQPIAQVSSHSRVFAQATQAPGLSLARRKSPSRRLVFSLSGDGGS